MNTNIEIFNNWATLNKDKSMESNHRNSVLKMFEIVKTTSNIFKKKFSFIDLGCGNGWTIRKILENNNCYQAVGIDGANNMILKANLHNIGTFIKSDIDSFIFKNKFDIIFSMETFYYLDNIQATINNIYNYGLKKNGMCIIGIDHYKENIPSLKWKEKYKLNIKTLTINGWIKCFEDSGFKNINHVQVGQKDNWSGTLIIYTSK